MSLVAGVLPVLAPSPASALVPATITQDNPARPCAGEVATVAWGPPDGVSDLTGYQVEEFLASEAGPSTVTRTFGPGTTSYRATLRFGLNSYLVYAMTPPGRAAAPFTSATIMGNIRPTAATWQLANPSAVGDHSATVSFAWFGPDTWNITGGNLPATVEVTAAPGGASQWSPLPHRPGATFSFTGLANGVEHTFGAVTSNACGSSEASSSPAYVPGTRPEFTQASPPLSARRNRVYRARFEASGDPAPTFRLVNAPRWLKISPSGRLVGRPPAGTTSFSYSVAATNAARPPFQAPAEVVAGPFTVAGPRGSVRKR